MLERLQKGREAPPQLAVSRFAGVKLSPMIFEDRGIDGNQKVNRLLADGGFGRIWKACVHSANQ